MVWSALFIETPLIKQPTQINAPFCLMAKSILTVSAPFWYTDPVESALVH